MKTVTNKKISFVTQTLNESKTDLVDTIKELDYASLIETCCNKASNPQVGFTYDEIKSIDRVKKAIKNKKEEVIEFEDADFDFVKKQVSTQTWTFAEIQLVEFMDYIKDLK